MAAREAIFTLYLDYPADGTEVIGITLFEDFKDFTK